MKRVSLAILTLLAAAAAMGEARFTSATGKNHGTELIVSFTERGLLKGELVPVRVNASITVVYAFTRKGEQLNNTQTKTLTTVTTGTGQFYATPGGVLANRITLHVPMDELHAPAGLRPVIVSAAYSNVTVNDTKNMVTGNVGGNFGEVQRPGMGSSPTNAPDRTDTTGGAFTSASAGLDHADLRVYFLEKGLFRRSAITYRVHATVTVTYGCEHSKKFTGGAGGNTKTITTTLDHTEQLTANGSGRVAGNILLTPPSDHSLCPANEKEVVVSVSYSNIKVEDTRNVRTINVTQVTPGRTLSRQFHSISQ